MVQGCDLIMELKTPLSKNVKVAVPTEEQKRIAQLSSIERIDKLQDTYISYMVDITKRSQEECAMQLAMTDMNVEQAIENLIEGNSEQWEVTKKRSRPEKKQPPAASAPEETKRSGKSSERGRAPKSESGERGDQPQERSRSGRTARGSGAVAAAGRGGSRGPVSTRGGGTAARGRGGKRQLPPRMDRQRHDRSESGSRDARDSASSTRASNRGRVNGSYRHHQRGAKRPTSSDNDWSGGNSEEWGEWGTTSTATTTTTTAAGGSDWGADGSGWGEGGWDTGKESETAPAPAPDAEATQQQQQKKESETPANPWGGDREKKEEPTPPVCSAPSPWSTAEPEQHKRPAYTQAFSSNPLARLTTSSSFSFPFPQQSSNVSVAETRHEQAPSSGTEQSGSGGSSSSHANHHHSSNSGSGGGFLQESLSAGSGPDNKLAGLSGRKISVEQLFKMHTEKPGVGLSETPIEEQQQSPASPPNSSTSSTNSTKKGSKRVQRTIPSEPVEMPGNTMPGNTMESMDVQFGSIFLDSTDDEVLLAAAEQKAVSTTPAPKTDAATSTTPGVTAGGPEKGDIPGIHKVGVPEQSPVRSLLQSTSSSVHQDTSPYTTAGGSLSLQQQQQQSSGSGSGSGISAAPPNLPPPNLDNIRTANNLMTSRSLSSETPTTHPSTSQFTGLHQQHPQQPQQHHHHQSHHPKKNLPPGIYPTNNSNRAVYYGAGDQSTQSQQQSTMNYDNMSRYYTSNSFEMRQQVQQPSPHESAFSSVSGDKQAHYRTSSDLGSTSHQPLHVGAGLSSGISSTNATGLSTAGYHAPLLGYTYPHPLQAYPNNALYANYYTPFNPAMNFAQQQKQSIPSYPSANAFGNTHADTSSPFGAQYEDYPKDLYGGGGGAKHPTTSAGSDYTKMMAGGGEKTGGAAGGAAGAGVFNMGGYMFPNYMQPNFQQAGQAGQAAAMMQQPTMQAQRGMDPTGIRSTSASLGAPKHYWSQR